MRKWEKWWESQISKENITNVRKKRASLEHVQKYKLYLTLRTLTLFLLATSEFYLLSPECLNISINKSQLSLESKCVLLQSTQWDILALQIRLERAVFMVHWRTANNLCMCLCDFFFVCFFKDDNKFNMKWIDIFKEMLVSS